jgi:integrase
MGRGWLRKDPTAGIEPVGRRSRGKAQLTATEARAYVDAALMLADEGHDGAVAALMPLLLGVRASEVLLRTVREVDGETLWISSAKTARGVRRLGIPKVLATLLHGICAGRDPAALVFEAATGRPHHRCWLETWVRRVCSAAGVPAVCPHGLRGTHTSLADEQGVAPEAVARSLGHESRRTTDRHYSAPGAADTGRAQRVLRVLEGGRGGQAEAAG